MEISASDKKNPDSTIENILFLVSDTGIGVSIRMVKVEPVNDTLY
jgi:hypothetical protein